LFEREGRPSRRPASLDRLRLADDGRAKLGQKLETAFEAVS
jgi:hypothetical protein